jgi:MFS family permease
VPPELVHLKNTFWSLAVALSTALAIVLAPLIDMSFGPVSDLLGRHTALLFIMLYFILGALMLMAVPINKVLRSTVSDVSA